MTKSSPALNIPIKTLKTDEGSKLILHKPRTERYPKGSCYFAIGKQMLKEFNLVFTKGALWRINHLNFKEIFIRENNVAVQDLILEFSNFCFQRHFKGERIYFVPIKLNIRKLILKPLLSRWRSLFRYFECIVKRFWHD